MSDPEATLPVACASAEVPAQAAAHRQGRRAVLLAAVPDTGAGRSAGGPGPSYARPAAALRLTRRAVRAKCGPTTPRAAIAAASRFAGTIGGWHWKGRTALAADWRILPPSPGDEATLHKIAARCDDRRVTARFPTPWRAEKMPGGYVVRDANGRGQS
jgi:hypothetical protein